MTIITIRILHVPYSLFNEHGSCKMRMYVFKGVTLIVQVYEIPTSLIEIIIRARLYWSRWRRARYERVCLRKYCRHHTFFWRQADKGALQWWNYCRTGLVYFMSKDDGRNGRANQIFEWHSDCFRYACRLPCLPCLIIPYLIT